MSGRTPRKKGSKEVKEATSAVAATNLSSPTARREPSEERNPSKPSVGHTPSFTPESSLPIGDKTPSYVSLANRTPSPQTLPSGRGSAPTARARLDPAVSPRRVRSADPQVDLTKPLQYNFSPPPPKPKRTKKPPLRLPKLKPPPVNQYGSYTLAEKGYVLGEQVATSNLSPGVTFYEGKKGATKVAIRMVDQTLIIKDYKLRVDTELAVIKRLKDRHIAKYFDMFKLKPENKVDVVVQEWLLQSLRDKITFHTQHPMTAADVKYPEFELLPSGVDLRTVRIWMGQLGQAIEYIHNKGYVHNRIDPDSVMVRSAHRVVLSHFLCVAPYRGRNVNKPAPFNNVKYMSPELVNVFVPDAPLNWDAKENDVWGFGCTCAFALSGSDLVQRTRSRSGINGSTTRQCGSFDQWYS